MNILKKIIEHKKAEVLDRIETHPIRRLEQSIYFNTKCVSLKQYINREDKSGIIAEFKRKSPSKGMMNEFAKVEETSIGYMQAGASALSILTDKEFFGGSQIDLRTARNFNYCPILRKDFIVHSYQVFETKAMGADAILLIAKCLRKEELKEFTLIAHDLDLEVLVEIHDQQEIDRLPNNLDLIGINNRNLDDFSVDFERSIQLVSQLPQAVSKIAESGITKPEDIIQLKQSGFDGFLIGELFMKSHNPKLVAKEFIEKVNKLS